ncbi:hypothetical protein STCU_11934 [Strigomonas culicis]|uniref:Cullin neddylation domain-containing protein n=1 Tax=Strigomonas culicis TaxID=28005 RepID=S9ULJ5_9TRYP|nr:hypothetical protein STCU_11934 [Strigomonas culicis]|eukprot:EPY15551.1 hypothetical protein STCU_11934 [Strigomonas culicis]
MLTMVVGHNKQAIEAVQAYVVEAMVGREELELIGSLPQTPLFSRSAFPEAAAPEAGLDALRRRIEAADLRLVHAVVWMVEECGAHETMLATMQRQLAQCCARHGWATAHTVLERVCGGAAAPPTPARVDGWAAACFVPTEADANKALRLAAEAYTCLRGTLLLLLAGTSHYLDHVTQFGRGCLIEGLESFLVGLCTHPAAARFVWRWGVPLWLQLCHATLEQQRERLAAEAQARRCDSGGRRHRRRRRHSAVAGGEEAEALAAPRTKDGAESTLTRSLLDARSQAADEAAGVAARPLGHALPPRALTGELDAPMRHALREVAARPVEGFPTLLYLLPRRHAVRRRLLDGFSRGVAAHLQELLREAQPSPPAAAALLPQPVFERCIFAARMTVQAFFQDDSLPLRAVDDDVGVAPPQTADGRQPSAAALSADDAVRAGLAIFFAATAASVELTLAQALHAQLLEDLSRPARVATLEVVDTLLDLASLLPSRDAFVRRYKAMVAPRLMHVAAAAELDTDTEIFARMALRLGAAATAPCLTLLRDLRQALSDAQRAEAGDPRLVLSLARLTRSPPPPHRSFHHAVGPHLLLRHARVLCAAWWQPHAPVLVTAGRLRRLSERGRWLHPAMVDAVLRMEHCYRGAPTAAEGTPRYVPYAGPATPGAAAEARRPPPSPATASTVARGVSSALSSVQQGSSRLYGNVRRAEGLSGGFGNDDPDDDAAFSEAYGGLLPPAAMSMGGGYASNNSTVSSIFGDRALSDGGSTVVSAVVAEGAVAQRRLQWPLSCGRLTFSIAPRRPGGRHALVGGPPLVLLFLQGLARRRGGCSFGQLLQDMPVRAPKPCWRYLMKALVAHRIVEREGMDAADGPATRQQFHYRLSDDFRDAPAHKVVIDLTPVLTALPPDAALPASATADGLADLAEGPAAAAAAASPASAYPPSSPTYTGGAAVPPPRAAPAAPVVNIEEVAARRARCVELVALAYLKRTTAPPTLEEEQEARRIGQGDSARGVTHSHLLAAIAEQLSGDFLVTNPLLKKALTKLIGKGFVSRTADGKSYYYLP